MIKRFYVHNFRCLENFELPISGLPSTLLIGANGAGKTTVGPALEILQRIARGINRVPDLVQPKDVLGRKGVPVRFEIEAELYGKTYGYSIAFEFPKASRSFAYLKRSFRLLATPCTRARALKCLLLQQATKSKASFSSIGISRPSL